jgi:hypothetical protein
MGRTQVDLAASKFLHVVQEAGPLKPLTSAVLQACISVSLSAGVQVSISTGVELLCMLNIWVLCLTYPFLNLSSNGHMLNETWNLNEDIFKFL